VDATVFIHKISIYSIMINFSRVLVNSIIKKYRDSGARIRSLLDIGCGEGALLNFMVGDTQIEQLSGIDIREERLKLAAQSLEPTKMDREYLRETPLDIKLYHGKQAMSFVMLRS
jgi:2-polyprenyl-3-methyl-5-hydroxy-6-metoxy-1,4-benzoquinol methylase